MAQYEHSKIQILNEMSQLNNQYNQFSQLLIDEFGDIQQINPESGVITFKQ